MAKVWASRDPECPADAVYIGRPGYWGNPWVVGVHGSRQEVIERYRQMLLADPKMMARLKELRGKDLVCFCKPLPCHGDVLFELANGYPDVEDLI